MRDHRDNIFYYMCILSASAIHGGAIRCPVWNTSHTADFMIHVRGDATLTIGPYRTAGTQGHSLQEGKGGNCPPGISSFCGFLKINYPQN